MKRSLLVLLSLIVHLFMHAQTFEFGISDPGDLTEPYEFCIGDSVTFTIDYQGWGSVEWYQCVETPDFDGWSNYDLWEYISVPYGDTAYKMPVTGEVYFWVFVSEGYVKVPSDIFHIQLKGDVPVITYSDTLFCEGSTLTLDVTPADLGDGKYQWYKNDVEIDGETNSSLIISEPGSYYVSALTNETDCPDIYYPGEAVNFYYIMPTISGEFKPDLNRVTLETEADYVSYQWYSAATAEETLVAIDGANAYTYNAQLTADDVYYAVEVETADACISTSERVLINNVLYSVPIILEPADTFGCRGSYITLSLENDSYTSYVWYKNGSSIWGATSASYDANQTGEYYVEVTTELDPDNVFTSDPINLYFPDQPNIIIKNDETLCPGASITLQVKQGWAGELGGYDTYQWLINDSWDISTAAEIDGATLDTLVIEVPEEQRYYFVRTTLGSCEDESYSKFIQEFSLYAPYISADPWDKQVCLGDTVTLSVWGSNVSFQWYFNGDTIEGAHESTFYATEVGYYDIEITSTVCPTSDPIMNNDSVAISYKVAPSFYVEPEGEQYGDDPNHRIFCHGDTISLLVENSGNYENWQWMGKLYDVNSTSDEWEDVEGETDSLFTFINGYNDKLRYKVRVDSMMDGGEVCTGISEYKLIDEWVFLNPAIASYDNAELCEEGDSTLLHLGFAGDWHHFEWYLDGELIPDSDNDTLWAIQVGEHTITAYPNLCPTIPHSSGLGPNVKFMPEAEIFENDTCIYAMPEEGVYEYQWYLNDEPIDPATLFPAWVIKKDQMDCGLYTVEVTNPAECTRFSEVAYEWRNPAEEVVVDASVCEGESYFVGGEEQTEGGTYIDFYYNLAGCDSIVTTNLVVNPLPVVNLGNDTTITESITLDAGEGYVSYFWNTLEETQAIVVDDSYGLGTHTFDVMVTDNNSCQNGDTILITIEEDISAAMINGMSSFVRLYPNPSNGIFNIELNDIKEEVFIEIISVEGKVIMSRKYDSAENLIEELNLSDQDSGWYYLIVKSRSFVKTEKFSIVK